MRFVPVNSWLCGFTTTLSFTTEEDDDLERLAQKQEAQRTTTIGFEFPRSLKNSATTF
jgi:hypothetical protein